MSEEESLKIVLLGESDVGKAKIITQLIDQTFQEDTQSTKGGAFAMKYLRCDNKILKLEIWDTAGQEKYRSLIRIFCEDAKAVILVYDITSKNSFEEIKNYWIKEVKELCNKNVILAIVGNNSDLFEREQVNEEEARKLAEDLGAIFVTNTFRSPESINYLFLEIAKKYTECSEVAFIEKDDIGRFQYFHTIITKKLSKWKNY